MKEENGEYGNGKSHWIGGERNQASEDNNYIR